MLVWEWRRIFRQKWRHIRPIPSISYAQYSRKRLIVSFVLFFIGWKVIGLSLNEKLLFKKDDGTGEMRYFEPWEMKTIVHEKRVALDKANEKPLLTKTQLSHFPLDD